MRCLVTGATGSDGRILCELLERQGHEVFGLVRDQKVTALPHGALVRGDLTDPLSIARVVQALRPDEIYNMGAFSHAGYSFDEPHYVGLVNALGPVNVYEAVRLYSPETRVYQASTSEMFGGAMAPQSEETEFLPLSPYGEAKAYAHNMAKVYRRQGVFIACGILFNHTSVHHGPEFLPVKVAREAWAIKEGRQKSIRLGALWPQRDWGWGPEYMDGVVKIIRHSEPDDFVLATGKSCAVSEYCVAVFREFGLNFYEFLEQDDRLLRPVEVPHLQGDATKAREVLSWEAWSDWRDVARMLAAAQVEAVAA